MSARKTRRCSECEKSIDYSVRKRNALTCSIQCNAFRKERLRREKLGLPPVQKRNATGRCSECGKPIDYSVRNRNALTCSEKCQSTRGNRRHREKLGLPPPKNRSQTGRCSECDKLIDYSVRSRNALTCSEKCQNKRALRKSLYLSQTGRCSECDEPIDYSLRNRNALTCSEKCQSAKSERLYGEKRAVVALERSGLISICCVCGSSYKTASVPNGWKYCSRSCRNVYREKKRLEAKIVAHEKIGKTLPKKDCSECGKPIDFTVRQVRSLTCSYECQTIRSKRKATPAVKSVRAFKGIDRDCSECGNKIDFKIRGTSAVTCSVECAEKRKDRLYELKRSNPQTETAIPLTTSHSFYKGDKERGFTLKPNHCIYCGDWYQCRDHIVPILVDAVERSYDPEKTCHCCNLCNNLAGDYWADSIEDKAQHILARYRRKFRVILFQNSWSDTELDDLMGGLHEFVRSKQNLKRLIEAKIDNLLRVSSGIEAIRLNDEVFYGSWGQR